MKSAHYTVYKYTAWNYIITYAGNTIGYPSDSIENSFNSILEGKAIHLLTPPKTEDKLFTCNSLQDAKENYPEYFI
ncbi:MAG: hypothetical protein BV456_03960 [Thermoplasmata archaeon M8B2D]|nr:MAG: hypothetical protein BV456_03960 [Thermoplasmata archaeon M8B2D]